MKHQFFLFCLGYTLCAFCQNDTINKLDEVEVKGVKKHTKKIVGQKSVAISEKQVLKNPTTLTNLLRFNAPINFKDYGNGGVSTARFRGTSPTNTLVLWNGIPINAFGNGQVDFNSISANTSDEILVNSGGSVVENGSGAIGGTIQLNDKLVFKRDQKYNLFSSFGSFETTSNFFKAHLGTEKLAVKLATTVNYSKNDYPYIDKRYTDNDGNLYKNENGRYKNYGLNLGLGYKLSDVNKLFFYSSGYYGDRLFSDGLPNPSSASERIEDMNQRNLLQWDYRFRNFKQKASLSYLTQEYRYYDDRYYEEDYNFGVSENVNVDYKLQYRYSNFLNFNTNIIYSNTQGKTNKVSSKSRDALAFVLGTVYKPFENTTSFFSIRKEYNSDFSLPISVYVGLEQQLSKYWKLTSNFSKNYRVPTFNELYWPQVGNLTLLPEKSTQGELGFSFSDTNFTITSSVFYIHLKDKILWLPAGGSNLWRPINVNTTFSKGMETTFSYTTSIFEKHSINIKGNYVYTVAKDDEVNKILPFVPRHLMNLNTEYSIKWFKIYLQTLFQSKVYTNQINITRYSLKRLFVNNVGVNLNLLKNKSSNLSLGLQVNNVQNRLYYFTNLRPMPNRNFNVNINYKF